MPPPAGAPAGEALGLPGPRAPLVRPELKGGKKSPKVVEAVYERFIRYYVVCPVCNSIDTELNREGRIFVMRCLACGASTPVKPL